MNTNLKPKLQRFASATAFACPICQENLTLLETNFKCCNRHSFDLAKFGYVNLAPQVKQSANYDKENFQNRQQILEAGFYQAILDAVSDLLASSKLPQQFWISVVVKDSILANYKKVTLKKLSMPLTSPKIQSKSLLKVNPTGQSIGSLATWHDFL